jgi:hypothetical protein
MENLYHKMLKPHFPLKMLLTIEHFTKILSKNGQGRTCNTSNLQILGNQDRK